MGAVKIITMQEDELRDLIRQETSNAIKQALAGQHDELLTIVQLCDKIPGLSRHLFKKLAMDAKLKNVRGKYSLKSVKDAMQSH